MEVRFGDIEQFQFFELLNKVKFNDYNKNFPKVLLHLINNKYPDFFNIPALENQLRLFYSDPEVVQVFWICITLFLSIP